MNPGDKVLVEAEIMMVGETHLMVRFPKVGPHPGGHVRVPIELVSRKRKVAA